MGTTMCKISREIGRQIGVLIDRRGKVAYVIAGGRHEVLIPNLSRDRAGASRLKGLRLIHTHLDNEPLSRDDLTDLAMLRLDLIMAIGVGDAGEPRTAYIAHINPDAEKPWEALPPEDFQRLSFPFGEFIEQLENELRDRNRGKESKDTLNAVLVHISSLSAKEAKARMEELSELARTEGIKAIDSVKYKGQPNPRNILGSGRIKELVIRALSQNADMILFDQELTPSQSRCIGDITDTPILDRTQLILKIFARRAHSSDGKLRVELARLKYMLPRLGLKDDALSRIRGGIGMRGPGETAMEVSRRRIKDRIRAMQKQLDKLGMGRNQRRRLRKRSGVFQVAVIGYTNAGKSTLLNAITKSSVLVEDKLFATLDPTSRRIRFPKNMEVVFSDTVGFIRDLPETLLGAFRSTLEELNDADLLLHLVDSSSDDYERELETVEKVLRDIGLDKIPRRIALNKIDKVAPSVIKNLIIRHNAIPVSALKGLGLKQITEEIVAGIEAKKKL